MVHVRFSGVDEELTEPANVDLETPDPAAANRAAFEQQFPGVLADGVVDAERLKELLDVEVVGAADDRERYGLMWAGKKDAVRSLQTSSRGTLNPDFKASVDWDNARHVFVEGDNLEVLKLLQRAYNDRVKMIYIDPPYNTGNDFVYRDEFGDSLRAYLKFSGQVDSEGNRAQAAVDDAGRKRSRWLSMMYPRLILARNLLTQDGYLFVSIGDDQVSTLRLLLDEIFGPENFVECFVWQSIFRPSNMSNRVRRNAEYIFCYQRSPIEGAEFVERYEEPKGEPSLTQNNNAVRDLEFPPGSISVKLGDGVYPPGEVGEVTLRTPLVVDNGTNASAVTLAGRFKWSQRYLNEEIAKGVFLTIKTSTFIPYYRKDYKKTTLRPTKLLPRDIVGDVLQANADLADLGLKDTFDYPKPTSLLRQLMRMIGVAGEDIVLDFFAGSGTTAHAVAQLNSEDDGKRSSISVNLPEPTPLQSGARRAGYETVSAITEQRIRLALGREKADSGLRVARLARSNFHSGVLTESEDLFDLRESTLADGAHVMENIAQEVLLKEGVRLDATWERHKASDAPVIVADGVAVVMSLELTQAIADAALTLEPKVVVFLEDGFADADAVKANTFTNAKNAGIVMKTV